MKIKLITVSKNSNSSAAVLFEDYLKRIKHYASIEHFPLRPSSLKNEMDQLQEEANSIQKKISGNEEVILLDRGGIEYSSEEFSAWLQKKLSASKNLCFIIGGAYGFHESLKKKNTTRISLSRMTLPHQLAKVIFAEQLYRAFTILRNEKYHH